MVWFGESLNRDVLHATNAALDKCDMCLLVKKIIINIIFSISLLAVNKLNL